MWSLLSSDMPSGSVGATLIKYLRLSYLLTTKFTTPGSEAGNSKIKASRKPMRHSVTQMAFCVSSQGGGALPGASFMRTLIPFMRFHPHSLVTGFPSTRAICSQGYHRGCSPVTEQPEHTPSSVHREALQLSGKTLFATSLLPHSALDTNSSVTCLGGGCKRDSSCI